MKRRSAGACRYGWLAACAGIFVGCSASEEPKEPGVTEGFYSSVADLFCAKVSRCCTDLPPGWQLPHALQGVKPDRCRTNLWDAPNHLERWADTYDGAVTHGNMTFVTDEAKVCLAAIDGASCEDFFAIAGRGRNMLRPLGRSWAACAGVFVPRRAVDEPCRLDEECTTGWCDQHRSPARCGVQPTAEAPCELFDPQDEERTFHEACPPGLVCRAREAFSKGTFCLPPFQDGEVCLGDDTCLSGRCAKKSSGDGERVCQPLDVCLGGPSKGSP